MGVYISFSIEVHRKDRWQPLIWYTKPSPDSNKYSQPTLDENGMETHYEFCPGSASPFSDALSELNPRCYSAYPDDMSDELKALLPNKDYIHRGYFMYRNLIQYMENEERTMLSNLLESRDFQLVKHMQRIEKAVLQKPIKDNIKSNYLVDFSVKELYEDYMSHMSALVRLKNFVEYLTDEFNLSLDDDEIRIIYYTE